MRITESPEEYHKRYIEAVSFVEDEFRKTLREVKRKVRKKYHIHPEDSRGVIMNGFEAFIEITGMHKGLFE